MHTPHPLGPPHTPTLCHVPAAAEAVTSTPMHNTNALAALMMHMHHNDTMSAQLSPPPPTNCH